MNEQKWTPGKMKVVDAVGAGLQLHVTLPKGFRFDCTQWADGATEFMVFTVRDRGDVAVGDFRWVQFPTEEWKVAEKANADRLAACWNAMDGIPDPALFVATARADAERVRELEGVLKKIASQDARYEGNKPPDDEYEIIRNIEEFASTALTPPAQPSPLVWLIERGQQEKQYPTLWWDGADWTRDPHKAIRYKTKQAAEIDLDARSGIAGVHSPFGRVAEHVFVETPHAQQPRHSASIVGNAPVGDELLGITQHAQQEPH